jgi:hypothetical protein
MPRSRADVSERHQLLSSAQRRRLRADDSSQQCALVERDPFVEKEHNRDVIRTPLGVMHDVGVV